MKFYVMKRKFAVFYFLHRLLKISPFLILSVKTVFDIVPYDVYANYFLNTQIYTKKISAYSKIPPEMIWEKYGFTLRPKQIFKSYKI